MSDSTKFSSGGSALAEASLDGQETNAPTAKERRRVLSASLLGTAVEWYDFFIYGSADALIFGPQFFPTDDPLAGTLYALATLAVGFIALQLVDYIIRQYRDSNSR